MRPSAGIMDDPTLQENASLLANHDAESQGSSADEELIVGKQLQRDLGLFETWATTFSCMNFVSGMPMLFGWVMINGGPQAALTSWTLVSTASCLVALSLAEISSDIPTTGGLYLWAYTLGGDTWGPILGWTTAWWNWSAWTLAVPGTQHGATNFLVSALEVNYPDATFFHKPWFTLLMILVGLLVAFVPSITDQKWMRRYLRAVIAIFLILLLVLWVWLPVAVYGRFRSPSFVLGTFHNGLNQEVGHVIPDVYCRLITLLFGAWEFGGYDASALLSEETKNAEKNVARGMWLSTVSTTLLSIPTLVLVLFCIQDFESLVTTSFSNGWAEFLVQTIGPRGATIILLLNWIDCTCTTAACALSAQRVAHKISKDGVLPGSHLFKRISTANAIPFNATALTFCIAVAVSSLVLGSKVAFGAVTASTVICQSFAYLIVLIARHVTGRHTRGIKRQTQSSWSRLIACISIIWLVFLVGVLMLPQRFPVTWQTFNYSPICLVIISGLSTIGWVLPQPIGGRHWFREPGAKDRIS